MHHLDRPVIDGQCKGVSGGKLIYAAELKRVNVWHYNRSQPVELNTAVRDIGLRSVSIDRGCGIFPKGRTSAHFRNDGKWLSLIDELKMELIGRLIDT
jgi:hypothetical protein